MDTGYLCSETLGDVIHVLIGYLGTSVNKLRYGRNYGRIRYTHCTLNSVSNEGSHCRHMDGERNSWIFSLLLLLLNFITK